MASGEAKSWKFNATSFSTELLGLFIRNCKNVFIKTDSRQAPINFNAMKSSKFPFYINSLADLRSDHSFWVHLNVFYTKLVAKVSKHFKKFSFELWQVCNNYGKVTSILIFVNYYVNVKSFFSCISFFINKDWEKSDWNPESLRILHFPLLATW